MIERVKMVASNIFNIYEVPDDLKIDDIEQWNSLGQINLILGIEQEFGVKIPTEKIFDLSSIEKIVAYLGKEIGKHDA